MRGITPVIAIILLLLMAVAAAGGFYFVYQGFTEEGEESGATQIEQLSETSLAAIQIESAAGGRIYVKNVGASTVDLSKLSVYVEDKPVSVNRSSDTLAERSREILKLTEVPSCASGECDVRISGAASASKKVDLDKLVCASDSDCLSGESCEGGVCVEGEGGTAVCGDGECAASEHGYDCWEDCHPESITMPQVLAPNDLWLSHYDWNGTTYDFVENVTDPADFKVIYYQQLFFLANGNHVAAGFANKGGWNSAWHSKYDGSSWSYPSNLSNQYDIEGDIVSAWPDVDSSGNGMFVWTYSEKGQPLPNKKVQWVTVQDNVASEPDNVTDWIGSYSAYYPYFAFAPDNSGFVVYGNVSDFGTHNNHKVLYSHWDGSSWDDTGVVANYPNVASADSISPSWPLVAFADNGDAMSVWGIENATNYIHWKYATHDGSSWSYQGNFESWTPVNDSALDFMPLELEYDHQGKFVFAASRMAGSIDGFQDFYFTYDGTWSANQTFPEASGKWLPSVSKTPDNTLFAIDMDYGAAMVHSKNPWRWTVWNGDGWSDPVYVGEWEAA